MIRLGLSCSITFAVAVLLGVLWVIGIMNVKGAHGMAAVGDGISAIFKAAGDLLGSIHF